MTNGKLGVEARRPRNTIDLQLRQSAFEQGEKEGRPEALLSVWNPLDSVEGASTSRNSRILEAWFGLLLISNFELESGFTSGSGRQGDAGSAYVTL